MRRALLRNIWVLGLVGLLPICGTGCGGVDEPPPTRIEGNIVASQDVNPNLRGQPSPVAVRFYELKAEAAFVSADFFQLYDSDSAVLGGDLQGRADYVLRPGETMAINKVLNPETRFLGVVAAYQDIDQATWRAVVPVRPQQTTAVAVALNRLDVAVQASPQDAKKEK